MLTQVTYEIGKELASKVQPALAALSSHPNLSNAMNSQLASFPPRKANTVVNFGRQGHAYVVERFGRFVRTAPPGLFLTWPLIETIRRVEMRQQVIDVARQNAYTKDNVRVSVAAQLFVTVTNAERACYATSQCMVAIVSKAQSALRVEIGKRDLDHLLADRNSINMSISEAMSKADAEWGLKADRFEITEIAPDEQIQVAMDKQSTAERQRRGSVIAAEGQKQSMELVAEGRRRAAILEAEGERNAAILRAEGVRKAAEMMTGVPQHLLQYNLGTQHIAMIGSVARDSKHTAYFLPRDVGVLPTLQSLMTDQAKSS